MSTNYTELIDKAYVKPIRSVVMIDDQFPTYTRLLERTDGTPDCFVSEPQKTYLKVLCDLCKEQHWTYHVEDHLPDSTSDLPYNADLVFLDFIFGEGDNGEKAIDAIKAYSKSDKFNFIVVYTEDMVSNAFWKIVKTLGRLDITINDSAREAVDNMLAEYGDIFPAIEKIAQENYCKYILDPSVGNKVMFESVKAALASFGITCGRKIKLLADWSLQKVSETIHNSSERCKQISGDINDEYNWLRIDRVFLTVINKSVGLSKNQLYDRITSATYAWRPTPGQLILKDVKKQIDDCCLLDLFESERHELAWFYFTYISEDENMQENDILYNLVDLVKARLKNSFHKKLKEIASEKGIEFFYPSFNLNNKKDIFCDINIFNSTLFLPETTTHFSTGMIFKDCENSNYWICMTQSCDLVPTQKSLKWGPGNYKPITFVKLHNQQLNKSLSNATRGNTVFFEENNVKRCFSIFEENTNGPSNPHYETFFAPNKGFIDLKAPIQIWQVDVDTTKDKLEFKQHIFSFVIQLRAEYASMLLQKVSNHRSRIPVNYINFPKDDESK